MISTEDQISKALFMAGVMIGSYPRSNDGRFSTQIVVRSRDIAAMNAAADAIRTAVADQIST